jgi:hypothetical protein
MTQETATSQKARRRADVDLVGRYYEDQLAALLERVREGFRSYDTGELNAFDLDDLVHRYKGATRELWKFCGSVTASRAGLIPVGASRKVFTTRLRAVEEPPPQGSARAPAHTVWCAISTGAER